MSVKPRGGPVPPSTRSAEGGPINGIGEPSLFFPSSFFFPPFLPSFHFAASRYPDGERVRPPTRRGRGDVVGTNTAPRTAGGWGGAARNRSRGSRCSAKKKKKRWGAETKSKGERWLLRPAACVSQRLVMSLSNHFLMPLAVRSEFTQVL